MKFLKLKLINSHYSIKEASVPSMWTLYHFFSDIGRDGDKWIDFSLDHNRIYYGTNITLVEKEGEDIVITYDFSPDESIDMFRIHKNDFIKMLLRWEKLYKQKPDEIIIMLDDQGKISMTDTLNNCKEHNREAVYEKIVTFFGVTRAKCGFYIKKIKQYFLTTVYKKIKEKMKFLKLFYKKILAFFGRGIPEKYIFGKEEWRSVFELLFKADKNGVFKKIHGFHHDLVATLEFGGLIKFKSMRLYSSGIYKGDVTIVPIDLSDVRTFFPASWSRETVLKKIMEANENLIIPTQTRWDGTKIMVGKTMENIYIRTFITREGKVYATYPLEQPYDI